MKTSKAENEKIIQKKSSTIFIPCLSRTPPRRWSTGSLLSAKNKIKKIKKN
jgi:hypothetical protein